MATQGRERADSLMLSVPRRRRSALMAGAAGLIGALSIAAGLRSWLHKKEVGQPTSTPATATTPDSPATAETPPPKPLPAAAGAVPGPDRQGQAAEKPGRPRIRLRKRTLASTSTAPPGGSDARARAAPPVKAAAPSPVKAAAPSPVKAAAPRAPVPAQSSSPGAAAEAYKRGNQRLLAGDAAGARQAFEEAVARDPSLAVAHRGLGLVHAQLGNRAASVRSLRTYLRLAPTAPDRALIRSRIQNYQ
jgi:hypothetical protein